MTTLMTENVDDNPQSGDLAERAGPGERERRAHARRDVARDLRRTSTAVSRALSIMTVAGCADGAQSCCSDALRELEEAAHEAQRLVTALRTLWSEVSGASMAVAVPDAVEPLSTCGPGARCAPATA